MHNTQTVPVDPVQTNGGAGFDTTEETLFFSLSYAQQRLWFLDQLQPGSSVYNIATALQVEGRLDLERLRRSLEEIVRRHEVLRTRVVVREGEPVQEITAAQGLALAVVDLRALPEEEREARARQLTEEEAGRPFDLGQGPLLRTVVLQLGREQQVLILNLHHIISDRMVDRGCCGGS